MRELVTSSSVRKFTVTNLVETQMRGFSLGQTSLPLVTARREIRRAFRGNVAGEPEGSTKSRSEIDRLAEGIDNMSGVWHLLARDLGGKQT